MKTPWPHQRAAIDSLRNGSVLVGGMGSGKSLVGLMYYYEKILGGTSEPPGLPVRNTDLYIITTAMKRDKLDWQGEAASFGISEDIACSVGGIKFVVDSWNNISKYNNKADSFFIFDEQKTMGYGVWSKSFIKIAKKNKWILMTATPADRWIDLMSVFIANGFYKNKRDFVNQHVVYDPYTKYPKIRMYINKQKLTRLKRRVFVIMPYEHKAKINIINVEVIYDKEELRSLVKTEWNPFTNTPVKNFPEQIHILRRVINSDKSRIEEAVQTHKRCKKLIIFYNFNYELDILRNAFSYTTVAEYNGHQHNPTPTTEEWVYLVQYISGNEAWECFETNHMLFYSANYSYRITMQAMGRINRLTTRFKELFYYRLSSTHKIDIGIEKAFNNKKNFNEKELQIIFKEK